MRNIADRLRSWAAGFRKRRELVRLDEAELARIAGDTGLTTSELHQVNAQGVDSAALLPRRLAAQRLTEEAYAHPAVLRDMQRLCSMCRSKGQCQRDLDADPLNPKWQEYCPNAGTMQSLR